VALAHNLLKVAGIRELLSVLNEKNTRTGGEKRFVFATCSILGTYWTAPFLFIFISIFCIAKEYFL
ncbi:hypothetical protein ACFQ38_02650, partial [Sporosarcina contaminans]